MIPNHDANGALPIVLDDANPHVPGGSPYPCAFEYLVQRFGTSLRRVEILEGLHRLRSELWQRGHLRGVQWVSGSFVEVLDREPGDVDVVTFLDMRWLSEEDEVRFFAGPDSKPEFDVDSYAEHFPSEASYILSRASYWYELWSRRRQPFGTRKGFVWLTLNEDPASAIVALKRARAAFDA